MNLSLVLSVIAVIISLSSFAYTIYSGRKHERTSALVTNHSAMVAVEARLSDVPAALRFHGIDPEDLARHGVTPQEFAYLVNSFSVGGTYYRTAPEPAPMLEAGTYYHRMCQS